MILLSLLLSTSITATCVPSANPDETREEVVDSFFDAVGRHDAAKIGAYIKPGATLVMGDDSMDLAEMMSAVNPDAKLTVLDKKFNTDKTIIVHYRVNTGTDSDETAVSVSQDGGCIVRIEQQ